MKRGTGDVPEEPGNKNDEQVAVRHADASDGYIMENQHEEHTMRDIHVSKRGSGATSKEQSDKWRKTERLEHEAPNTSASSDPCDAMEYPVSGGETQSRPGPVLVQKSGRADGDVQIFALDSTGRMDEGVVFIGDVLERYRGEDAGYLQRIELFEKWTCLNVLEKKLCTFNLKILME